MDEKINYKGQTYNIQELKDPKKKLSQRKMQALKSYERKQKSETCKGFFGVSCDKKVQKGDFCNTCYQKQSHMKGVNSFISDVFDIDDMDVSSSNLLNFSQSKCITCTSQKCTVTHPFCVNCLSSEFGLAIRKSFIPGAGLGLFATKDMKRGAIIELDYKGRLLNMEEFEEIRTKADSDLRSAKRMDYIMEVPRKRIYIDASDETGGPLRYINQSPSDQLTNCKWTMKKNGKITVQLLETIKNGCEFYLDYSEKNAEYSLPLYTTIDGLEQQASVCKHFIMMKQSEMHKDKRKSRRVQ